MESEDLTRKTSKTDDRYISLYGSMLDNVNTHTHTHTHIYIYIYIYNQHSLPCEVVLTPKARASACNWRLRQEGHPSV